MTDPQAQEAARLADDLMAVHRGHADEGPSSFSEAASLLRTQAARIAELERELVSEKAHREMLVEIGSQSVRAAHDVIAALCAELARMREPLSDEHRRAIGVCMEVGHVCVATVQRNLRIGWNRARDILVDLVQRGALDGLPLSAEFDGITKTGGGV